MEADETRDSSGKPADIWIGDRDIIRFFHPPARAKLSNLMIGITIHSQGKGTLLPVASRFYLGDPDEGAKTIGTGFLKMEAGQPASSSIRWKPEGPGEHRVFVVVDPDNTIAETDETNNCASRTLKVDSGGGAEWI